MERLVCRFLAGFPGEVEERVDREGWNAAVLRAAHRLGLAAMYDTVLDLLSRGEGRYVVWLGSGADLAVRAEGMEVLETCG